MMRRIGIVVFVVAKRHGKRNFFAWKMQSLETWWDAEVIDVDMESRDEKKSNFFVQYKASADNFLGLANVSDDDYVLEPLINMINLTN